MMSSVAAVHLRAASMRRESSRYPGLVLELVGDHLVFTYEEAREVFRLRAGEAEVVASSEQAYRLFELFDYVRATAVAYAEAGARRSA